MTSFNKLENKYSLKGGLNKTQMSEPNLHRSTRWKKKPLKLFMYDVDMKQASRMFTDNVPARGSSLDDRVHLVVWRLEFS